MFDVIVSAFDFILLCGMLFTCGYVWGQSNEFERTQKKIKKLENDNKFLKEQAYYKEFMEREKIR